MATIQLGKIKFVIKGNWSIGTTYYKNDIVVDDNRHFVCIVDSVIAQAPLIESLTTNNKSWNLGTKYTVNSDYWQQWDGDVSLAGYKGDWVTLQNYNTGEIVSRNGALYYCIVEHNSSTLNSDPQLNEKGFWEIMVEGGANRTYRRISRMPGEQPPGWRGHPTYTATWGANTWQGNIPWNIPTAAKKENWNLSAPSEPASGAGGLPGFITWHGGVASFGQILWGDGLWGYGGTASPVDKPHNYVDSHNAYVKSTFDFGGQQDVKRGLTDDFFYPSGWRNLQEGHFGAAQPRVISIVANGYSGYAALFSDGSIQIHGYNNASQYGAGDHTGEYAPGSHLTKDHFGGYKPIKIVSTGGSGSDNASSTFMVLDENGEIWTWGENTQGAAGIGPELGRSGVGGQGYDDNTDVQTPICLPSDEYFAGAKVVDIFAGGADLGVMACLTSDGKLWTWGYNAQGALGFDTASGFTSTDKCFVPYPLPITWSTYGGIQKVFIAGGAGLSSLWVLDGQGQIWNCGYNGAGILGDGTTTNVVGLTRRTGWSIGGSIVNFWVTNTRGYNNAWFRHSNGNVYGVGDNGYYQLDTGNATDQTTPVLLNNLTNPVNIVAAGEDGTDTATSAIALDQNGYVYGAGSNAACEFGTGIVGDNNTNVSRLQSTTESRFGWRKIPLPRSFYGNIIDVRFTTSYYTDAAATPVNNSIRVMTVLNSWGALGFTGGTNNKSFATGASTHGMWGGVGTHHYWGQ